MTSVQAAKATISARIGRPITARLVDLPPDLRRAVVLLAMQYRAQKTRATVTALLQSLGFIPDDPDLGAEGRDAED